MSDPVVRVVHVRKVGLCTAGARTWFAKNELDWKHFLDHGYPASVIESKQDELGNRVARAAREDAP